MKKIWVCVSILMGIVFIIGYSTYRENHLTIQGSITFEDFDIENLKETKVEIYDSDLEEGEKIDITCDYSENCIHFKGKHIKEKGIRIIRVKIPGQIIDGGKEAHIYDFMFNVYNEKSEVKCDLNIKNYDKNQVITYGEIKVSSHWFRIDNIYDNCEKLLEKSEDYNKIIADVYL